MKNTNRKNSGANKTLINGTIALFIVALIALGCTCGRGSGSAPAEYVGSWTGSDGSTLAIRGDGSGDYKGSSEVTNGSVEIKDGKLSVTLFGFGKTMNIDESPKNGQMKLDGIVYKLVGGTTLVDTKSDDKKTEAPAKKADASKAEIPADDELQYMAKTTLLDFNDAIQQADFTNFHRKIAKAWQKQVTPEQFKQGFNDFIVKKVEISEIKQMDANFTSSPKIDKSRGLKELVVEGRYDTSPLPTKFKLNYVPEGKEWKLYGIEVNTRKDD